MVQAEINQVAASLQEIKINTEILVTKLDQVYDSIEKLEASVEHLHTSSDVQDTRLTVVEQSIPKDLLQDIALLKQSQKTTTKLLWLLGSGTIAALLDALFNVITK